MADTTRKTLLQRAFGCPDPQPGTAFTPHWDEFYATYQPKLLRYSKDQWFQGGKPNSISPEDLAQNVFRDLWAKRNTFEYQPGTGSFRAYLKTLVHHKFVDHLRKKGNQHKISLDDRIQNDAPPRLDTRPAPPDESLISQQLLKDLEVLSHQLACQGHNADHLEGYLLFLKGDPIQDICHRYQINPNHWYQIKHQLSKLFSKRVKENL